MYPTLEVFGHAISMYWLSCVVGIIFAFGLAVVRSRAARFHTGAADIVYTLMCAVIGALFGSKVFQLAGLIIRDGRSAGFWTLEHWKGLIPGVGVFYGGLIGGFIAVLLYIRKYKLDFL